MKSKPKEYEMEFGGKKYIFRILPKKIVCINDNESYFIKSKLYNYEELKPFIEKKKIEIIKYGKEGELYIKNTKVDIYDEIKLCINHDDHPEKKEIKSNGKIFIKELIKDNIYISYKENGKTRKFKITQDNSDKGNIEYDFELFGVWRIL